MGCPYGYTEYFRDIEKKLLLLCMNITQNKISSFLFLIILFAAQITKYLKHKASDFLDRAVSKIS